MNGIYLDFVGMLNIYLAGLLQIVAGVLTSSHQKDPTCNFNTDENVVGYDVNLTDRNSILLIIEYISRRQNLLNLS